MPASAAATAVMCAWRAGDEQWVGTPAIAAADEPFESVARETLLPFRPHELLVHAGLPGRAIAVARRPGDYLAVLRWREGVIEALVDADAERVFEGHACVSPDGRTLLTAETNARTGAGTIAVRDLRSLATLGEWPLPGIGPHALAVGPDGALWVALGGILTLPETGRTKRDLDRMDPALLRLSSTTGRVTGAWRLPDARLGIRHLAISAGGVVGVALQAEHDDPERRARAPVFALLRDGVLETCGGPTNFAGAGYGADIVCVPGRSGPTFAVSCPRSDEIGLWGADGSWRGRVPLKHARALACVGSRLLAASEDGGFLAQSVDDPSGTAARPIETGLALDNHMTVVAT